MLQTLYTDSNGQPIYIMSQQPTLIPLQLQQPSLQIGQPASQANSSSQVHVVINTGYLKWLIDTDY